MAWRNRRTCESEQVVSSNPGRVDSTASDIQDGHHVLQMYLWLRSWLPRQWLHILCRQFLVFGFCVRQRMRTWNWLYRGQEQWLPVRVHFLCVHQRTGTRCRAHWDRQICLISVHGSNLKLNCSWKAASVKCALSVLRMIHKMAFTLIHPNPEPLLFPTQSPNLSHPWPIH